MIALDSLASREGELLFALLRIVGISLVLPSLAAVVYYGRWRGDRARLLPGWLAVWAGQTVVLTLASAWEVVDMARRWWRAGAWEAMLILGVLGAVALAIASVRAVRALWLGRAVLAGKPPSRWMEGTSARLLRGGMLGLAAAAGLFFSLYFVRIPGRFGELWYLAVAIVPLGLSSLMVLVAGAAGQRFARASR